MFKKKKGQETSVCHRRKLFLDQVRGYQILRENFTIKLFY